MAKGVRARAAMAIVATIAGTAGTGTAAEATLGERLAGVEADGVRLRATVRSAAAPGRTVHSLDMPAGVRVREIARADGTVFAVTWRGTARPDLRQLLGDRFAAMQAAPVIRRGVRLHGPLAIRAPGLVIRAIRTPGGFTGYAYAPDLAPADLRADDLR